VSRVFVDSNVPIYAAGAEHPFQAPTRRVLRAIAAGDLQGVTSVEALQEVLHRYLRRGERDRGLRIFDAFHRAFRGSVLPVDDVDVQRARALAPVHVALQARDLLHLAVMERHGITDIVTADRHFDGLPGIHRIDPREFRA